MDCWIFLNENFQTTEDFEDSKYVFIFSEFWSNFLSEYEGIYDTTDLCSNTWLVWEGVWRTVESNELLAKLNAIKEELKKNQYNTPKVNTKLPESSYNKNSQIYKVIIEDMSGSTIRLDCATNNITDALHAIATAADPNIFGKRVKKFTIEVIRE